MILLVIDRVNKNFAILPLDRDAMVSLEIPDEDGNILGENTMQLALAYAYGDGKEQSCELAEDAVSGLLHDQRIDGYVSLSMDAIGAVNHLVGGVDVTVTDDFAGESGLASGQTVHLSDAQAETFVRGRKSVGDGSRRALRRLYAQRKGNGAPSGNGGKGRSALLQLRNSHCAYQRYFEAQFGNFPRACKNDIN